MKRLALLILVALCGVALGAGATKLAWYPYVPDELNESCGKSLFEWNIMANRVDATPVPLTSDFDIIKFEGEPRPQGLIIRIHLRPRTPKLINPDLPTWDAFVGNLITKARTPAYQRFGEIRGDGRVYLLVHIEDRLVGVFHAMRQVVLKPNATHAEQLAAMAQVLGATAKP